MITQADIAHWQQRVPWPALEQVEQDLVLSRLIAEIANHPLLGNELVFRGGTCLHKLWLDRPWRYSEDLDYVRRSAGGIGTVLDAIRDIAGAVGFDQARTDVRQHPKVRLESTFVNGDRMRIKIEMNTFERSPARPTTSRRLNVDSPWFTGHADVSTFALEELAATKIRALFQRKKGRDLFDLWLTVEQAGVLPQDIAACFGTYRPNGWTENRAFANLDAKLEDRAFAQDLSLLLPEWPADYTVHAGAEVAKSIIQAIATNKARDER
ncbi:nucleotidyl transferase AbiEii/AbiGii toxin family protein [Candidatus Poriferisocius sp.]|uniref:nucleotidyl transferase AbiEii/AbiGii toxin family protein n=1 Tax=Candidatus Poriferisocius sp. TaxID=3101276 RepID=UPI003B01AE8D